MNEKNEYKTKELIAERFNMFGNYTNQSLQFTKHTDILTDSLAIQLRAYMLCEETSQQEHTFSASWPENWWQHLKKEKFPKWLLKKYPVKYTGCKKTVEFTERVYYPEVNTDFRMGQGVVKIHSLETNDIWRAKDE